MGKGDYNHKKKAKTIPCKVCGKLFAYERSAGKCQLKSKPAPGLTLSPGDDMQSMFNALARRIDDLEAQAAVRKLHYDKEIAELKERIGRGKYTMRAGKPRFGFGQWDSQSFLDAVIPACEWFSSFRKVYPYRLSKIEFVANVLYVMNGHKKAVVFSKEYPKGKDGQFLFCDLNMYDRHRKREPMRSALKHLYESEFLPSKKEMVAVLSEAGHDIKDASFLKTWDSFRAWFHHKGNVKHGVSETQRQLLVDELAKYEPPVLYVQEDASLETMWEMLGIDAYQWQDCDPEDLTLIGSVLGKDKAIELLSEHFDEHPDRFKIYIEEGGKWY